jgi:hypothetical protein
MREKKNEELDAKHLYALGCAVMVKRSRTRGGNWRVNQVDMVRTSSRLGYCMCVEGAFYGDR